MQRNDTELSASEPGSTRRPTFRAQAEQLKAEARASVAAEVEAIRERGRQELRALREAQHLELAAQQGASAARKRGKWPLLLAMVSLGGAVAGTVLWQQAPELSSDATWTDIPLEHDVEVATALSDSFAEREMEKPTKRSRHYRPQRRRTDKPCTADPWDPMGDCWNN